MHQTTESCSTLQTHTIISTITHAVPFPFFNGTPFLHTLLHFLWIKNENKGLVQHHNKNTSQLTNVQCKKLNIHHKNQSLYIHVPLSISNTSLDSIDLQKGLLHNGFPLLLLIHCRGRWCKEMGDLGFKHLHPQEYWQKIYNIERTYKKSKNLYFSALFPYINIFTGNWSYSDSYDLGFWLATCRSYTIMQICFSFITKS